MSIIFFIGILCVFFIAYGWSIINITDKIFKVLEENEKDGIQ